MTKNFTWGDHTFKGYFIKAGTGFEIGYKFNNKNYFVSNFIDRSEASKWWMMSQKHMTTFCKNDFSSEMNTTFLTSFFASYMKNHYYNFLKTVIAKNHDFSMKSYKKDFARYSKLSRTFAA